MIETAGLALTTLFATIGPIGVSAMFAALTASETPEVRRAIAIRGTLIASIILLGFTLIGENLLTGLGISLAALRISGAFFFYLLALKKYLQGLPVPYQRQKRKNERLRLNKISQFFHWRHRYLLALALWVLSYC